MHEYLQLQSVVAAVEECSPANLIESGLADLFGKGGDQAKGGKSSDKGQPGNKGGKSSGKGQRGGAWTTISALLRLAG